MTLVLSVYSEYFDATDFVTPVKPIAKNFYLKTKADISANYEFKVSQNSLLLSDSHVYNID